MSRLLQKLLLVCGIVMVMHLSACADSSDGSNSLSNGIVSSVDDLSHLQPGHWYKVANSALKNLGWNDDFPCNSPYYKDLWKITDYSGAAVSQRDRTLLLHGGGFAATAFNGILGFDLDTLAWTCIDEGSEKAVQRDWAPGKHAYLDTRIVVAIDKVLHLFKVTWTYSDKWIGTTGRNEPEWTKASRKGESVSEDNDQIKWTNQGIIGWQANHDYHTDTRIITYAGVKPSTKSSLKFFKCTSQGGMSDKEEPDWSSAVNYGDTVIDGELTWTNMGDIYYQRNGAKQEHGGYPWDDKVGAVQSYSHLVFFENKNAFIKPISFSSFPSRTSFINDHPWLYDMDADQWTEWPIDSELNHLGMVNLSSMAIDQKRDVVWMYRKGGRPGPRLWSLDLNERTWTARDDGKISYGSGAVAYLNPDTDELILYGTYEQDVYAVFSIDPLNFDEQGFVKRRYLYKKGSIGVPPSGDFDFVSTFAYQSHYAAYDTQQDVFVTYVAVPDAADDQKQSVYLLLPEKHHWIKIPSHPDNHMRPTIDVSRPYGRWNYIEAYNVFIYVDSIKNDVFLYKLSEDTKDVTPPEITDFSVAKTSSSRTIAIDVLTADDAHQWTVKYAVTESAEAPTVTNPLWLDSPPKEYRITSPNGEVTLYAYAMDMFGNISKAATAVTTLATDMTPPVITSFAVSSRSDSLHIDIEGVSGSDNTGVTGYLVTESSETPDYDDPGWATSPPAHWSLTGGGEVTLHAWLKDAAGNISAPVSASVSVVLSEHVPGALQVGPHREHKSLASAISAANRLGMAGQRIEIDAGLPYAEESEVYITVDDLTIVGVSGDLKQRARLYPHDGKVSKNAFISNRYDGKGAGLTLQWLEISGLNEPAIKYHGNSESARLLIEDCKIYRSSDTGVLVGAAPELSVVIRRSEFHSNGNGSGQYHNIYIGSVKEFLLEQSYTHDSNGGQLVKSRAAKNMIRYNRITDEGLLHNSNQLIDLPYGGESYVIGNLLHMSTNNTSGSVIQWAREVWAFVRVESETAKLTAYPNFQTYKIVREGVPTGETYRATYYYVGGLEGRGDHKTAATMPDLRVGDVLTWNNGANSAKVTSVRFPWAEGRYARHLYVAGNTIVIDRKRSAYLVRSHKDSEEVVFINNLIVDRSGNLSWDYESVAERRITRKSNNLWFRRDPGLVDIDRFDYSLNRTADVVIDQGTEWGASASGVPLIPQKGYRHPLSFVDRRVVNAPDVGAYEFQK